MSQINVDTIRSRTGTAPQLDKGAEVTVGYGITGDGGINVGGAITCGNLSAADATFSGTLTYEDVTNVDVVGFATFQKGVNITGVCTGTSGFEFGAAGVGGTITSTGQAEFVGVVTASDFVGGGSQLTGLPAGFTELDAALFN